MDSEMRGSLRKAREIVVWLTFNRLAMSRSVTRTFGVLKFISEEFD
jgi:hypothetical protein